MVDFVLHVCDSYLDCMAKHFIRAINELGHTSNKTRPYQKIIILIWVHEGGSMSSFIRVMGNPVNRCVSPHMWYQILNRQVEHVSDLFQNMGHVQLGPWWSWTWLDPDHIDVSTLQLYLEPDSTAMDPTPSSNQSSSPLLSTWPNWSAPLTLLPCYEDTEQWQSIWWNDSRKCECGFKNCLMGGNEKIQ